MLCALSQRPVFCSHGQSGAWALGCSYCLTVKHQQGWPKGGINPKNYEAHLPAFRHLIAGLQGQ